MAQTLKFGNGTWATKKDSILAYNDENENYKPLPFNYTGAGKGTRVNKEGLIEVVENDRPRIDYLDSEDGVFLLENASTNLVTYSEAFDNSSWTKSEVSVNPNNVISPNGTLNADAIIESTTSNAYHRVLPTTPISGTGGTNYSCSVYVKKKGDTRHIYWFIQKGADAFYVHIDMTNYVVGDSNSSGSGNLVDASITPVGNDWYRISVSGVVSSISGDYYNQIYLNKQLGSGFTPTQYTGDGTSGLYLWGWQLEQNSVASSYIPTQGTIQTRLAETANGSGNSEVFNDSEGVLFAELNIDANDGNFRFLSISDGTSTNAVWLYYRSDANQINFRVIVGGVSSFDQIYTINNATLNTKLLLKYKENDFSAWVNGFEVLTDNSGITFSGNVLNELEFNRPDGINNFYGKTKEIGYYNTILTDIELETLTSYRTWLSMVKELNLNVIYNG